MFKKYKKEIAASLSILSNGFLITLKLIAGILSGSISIISEAIHSTLDFLASAITFFAIMRSKKPADKEHPFGHGRYEDVSGFIEGILIICASFFIMIEACKKIADINSFELNSTPAIIIMILSVVINYIVSKILYNIGKKADSVALKADAKHLSSDIYSSLGVLFGLVLIKITGYIIIDSIIAIFIALFILKTGYYVSKEAFNNLVDGTLPDEDINAITKILNETDGINGYINLKSRKSGPNRDIDITILCNENMTLKACHQICDDIEEKIMQSLPNTLITIHCEPDNKQTFM